MPKVLVYGWYHQKNIGDDLFIQAYQHLFPDFDFIFSDSISLEKLKDVDAVFFGGGSFLLDRPSMTDAVIKALKSKKIFYLGVGIEAHIHPIHMDLMSGAKMIATRSPDQVDRLRLINKNASFVPDLIYSLQDKVKLSEKVNRSILIMPNVSVLPNVSDQHWKHASWTYFKSEFSQFLDFLIEKGYQISLFSMCRADKLDDDWAAAELISLMERRNSRFLLTERPSSIEDITGLVSKHELVITQRFHGIVLSEMTRTPYIAIHHHDKLKYCQPGQGTFLSYYNSSKHLFINATEDTIKMNYTSALPVESAIFKTFIEEVVSLI